MKFAAFPLVAVAALSGCQAAQSNPLLGHWTSTTPAAANGACPEHYTFTPTSQTVSFATRDTTTAVTYTVQPDITYVDMQIGSDGFRMTSPNTIQASFGDCTYKRD